MRQHGKLRKMRKTTTRVVRRRPRSAASCSASTLSSHLPASSEGCCKMLSEWAWRPFVTLRRPQTQATAGNYSCCALSRPRRRTSCAEELRGRGSTFVAERWFGLPREDARPASFHHFQSTRFVNGTNPQQARRNMEAIAISTTDMAASAEYIPPLH